MVLVITRFHCICMCDGLAQCAYEFPDFIKTHLHPWRHVAHKYKKEHVLIAKKILRSGNVTQNNIENVVISWMKLIFFFISNKKFTYGMHELNIECKKKHASKMKQIQLSILDYNFEYKCMHVKLPYSGNTWTRKALRTFLSYVSAQLGRAGQLVTTKALQFCTRNLFCYNWNCICSVTAFVWQLFWMTCNEIIPNNKISLCILPMAGCSGEHFAKMHINIQHNWGKINSLVLKNYWINRLPCSANFNDILLLVATQLGVLSRNRPRPNCHMVIRVELFIHRPCQTEDTCNIVVHD